MSDTRDNIDFRPQPAGDEQMDPLVKEALALASDPFYLPKRFYKENQELFDKPIKAAGEYVKSEFERTVNNVATTYDATIDHIADKPLTAYLEGPFAILHGLISRSAKDQQKLIDNARNLLNGTTDMGTDFRQRQKDLEPIRLGKDGKATPEWKEGMTKIRKEKELARTIEGPLTSGNLDDLRSIVSNTTTDDLRRVVPKVQKALDLYHTGVEVSVSDRGRLVLKERGSETQVEITPKGAEVTVNGKTTFYDPASAFKALSGQIVERIKEDQEVSAKDQSVKAQEPVSKKPTEIKTTDNKAADTKTTDGKTIDEKKMEVNKPKENKPSETSIEQLKQEIRANLKEEVLKAAKEIIQRERQELKVEREAFERKVEAHRAYLEAELAKIAAEKRALEADRVQLAKERETKQTPMNQSNYSGQYYLAPDGHGRLKQLPIESEEGKEYARNYGRTQQQQCRSQRCH